MKTSLFALAVLVAMTTAALPQSRTFYDSTTGRVTGRSTTDSGGATTYYGADGRVTGRPATPRRSITLAVTTSAASSLRPPDRQKEQDHGSVK